MKDYMDAAMRTRAEDFYGNKVGYYLMLGALENLIRATDRLDQIKAALFYGKTLPGADPDQDWVVDMTATDMDPNIIHAILGIATEGGELAKNLLDVLLKERAFVEGRKGGDPIPAPDFDRTNLKEEGGDIMWFLALMFTRLGTTFTEEGQRNIAKLFQRFPDRFNNDRAIVRNLGAERETLENHEHWMDRFR